MRAFNAKAQRRKGRGLILFFLMLAAPLMANPWGKDADIAARPCVQQFKQPKSGPLILFANLMIGFHQTVISPADGPRSHYKPSSSQYTLDAIHKYGFFYGCLLGFDRLMRENSDPWVYPVILTDNGLETKWDPVK